MFLPLPYSTLFPYTTLFRSVTAVRMGRDRSPGGVLLDFRVEPEVASRHGEGWHGPRRVDHVLPPGRETRLGAPRSEEHTSELQSPCNLVCRLLLEKKKRNTY